MKVMANVGLGFHQLVYGALREAGHEVIVLGDEVRIAEVMDIFEQERPGAFLWDPGEPSPNRCPVVQAVMNTLGYPPTVFFNALPNEWAAYCSEKIPNVRVVGLETRDFDAVLQEVVGLKA